MGKLSIPEIKDLLARVGIEPDMRVVDYIKTKMREAEQWQAMFYEDDNPQTMLELYKVQPNVFTRFVEAIKPEEQRGSTITNNLGDMVNRRVKRMPLDKLILHLNDFYASPDAYDRYIFILAQDEKSIFRAEPRRFTTQQAGTGKEIKEVKPDDFVAPDHLPKTMKAIWENYQASYNALKDNFGGEVMPAHDKNGVTFTGYYTNPDLTVHNYNVLWYKHRGDEVKQPVFTFGSMAFILPAVAELIRQQYQKMSQRQEDESGPMPAGLPAVPPVLQ
jgi:hypothetical protein